MGGLKEKLHSQGVDIVDSSGVTLEDYKTVRMAALESDPQAFSEPLEKSLTRPEEKWQERLDQARAKKTSWMLFAKEQNSGKIVGMIGGYRSEEDMANGTADIWGVYVDKTKRGQGIAAALMEGVMEELAQDPTIKTVKLEVNIDQLGAKNLYTKFGFVVNGDSYPHAMGDGSDHQVLAMEKSLK